MIKYSEVEPWRKEKDQISGRRYLLKTYSAEHCFRPCEYSEKQDTHLNPMEFKF